VIHFGAIGYVLGRFIIFFAGAMGVPLLYGAMVGDGELLPLLYAAAVTATAGGCLMLAPRPDRELTQREGLLLAVSTWLAVCLFGSLPFVFSPYFTGFTDAIFESVSGFTTTGSTILTDVEVLPPAIQFWRCFSHWLGGMGSVLLGVAVLPLVGHGGMHLYRAAFSGATSEKLKPRIMETALSLWKIYFSLTAALYLMLRWAGMNNFDALCHTFSTLGTGGFSTRTASVAAFESPLIEFILILFMLLAGVSFIQHYHLWVERRPRRVLRDPEIVGYVALVAIATVVIASVLIGYHGYEFENGLRSALFQVSAILTGTGFVSDNFEAWHPLPQLILLALMFIGGCTASTAGGLKVSRVMLLAPVVNREFKRMVERRGVFAVRLGGAVVPEATVQSLLNLVYLALVVNFISCLALAAVGVDVLTAIAAVAAAMFNVGPGLGQVGPLDNYASLPALAKWVLCGDMIAGRLEFYTTIVILTPMFWRK
jgi:trk system potassium uptake protein TrkH